MLSTTPRTIWYSERCFQFGMNSTKMESLPLSDEGTTNMFHTEGSISRRHRNFKCKNNEASRDCFNFMTKCNGSTN
jgi:hypothetical protein